MYLNVNLCNCDTVTCSGLTLTLDVFKSSTQEADKVLKYRLTLTLDVFKWD